MKFDKLKFVVLLYWRGSALAFPSGEGGTANAVTEEVYRQYVFAKTQVITQLFTAPLPGPVAVPEKIIVLTLILDFFDRCHSLRSLLPPLAALPSLPYVGFFWYFSCRSKKSTSSP